MKKLLLMVSFFVTTPFLLCVSLVFLGYHTYQKNYTNLSLSFTPDTKTIAYAALPTNQNRFQFTITQQDARVAMLEHFFSSYGSPLKPYALNIVTAADKYKLDFRLLPAIAMQESNVCKKIPKNSYNCWGFGIYGGRTERFDDYGQAIETVSKILAKHYIGNGLNTPEEIMHKYTPSSNGSWAFGVSQFMDQLQ